MEFWHVGPYDRLGLAEPRFLRCKFKFDILRWIGEDTPQREWPNWSHRTTAKALQSEVG